MLKVTMTPTTWQSDHWWIDRGQMYEGPTVAWFAWFPVRVLVMRQDDDGEWYERIFWKWLAVVDYKDWRHGRAYFGRPFLEPSRGSQ